MPYNPGISYVGDRYIAQAFSNLGSSITDTFKKIEDQQKVDAYNDLLVQHAYEKGQLTPEEVAQYNDMSPTRKTGFAAGLAANTVADWKRQQMALDAEKLKQVQAETLFKPSPEAFAAAEATGNKLIEVAPHKYVLSPYGEAGGGPSAGAPTVVPFVDPTTQRVVPGLAIATMPGTKQMQVVTIPQEQVQLDPTGNYRYDTQKRGYVPLTMQEKLALKIPTGPEAEARPNLWQRTMPTWLGGVTPTPAPTPATTPIPQQTGNYNVPARSAGSAAPVRVNSPEEAAKLPSGTLFIDPNGVVRTVP